MSETVEERAARAAQAEEEEVPLFVHDPSAPVIRALLSNRHVKEEHVLIIANRKNLPGDIIETIAKDKRWMESYPLRLALARNPKTPLFAALSHARYLRLFDLADLSRSTSLPLVYRHKIEAIVIEKIPTMALGIKRSLAKHVAGNVLLAMLQDGDLEVVRTCLANPRLTEGHLYKIISRHDSLPATIRLIAEHPNWSSRSVVRLALTRNCYTPLAQCVRFFEDMKISDLRELYQDPSVPVTVKPHIHSELIARGEDADRNEGGKEIYEIEQGGADREAEKE